jgi:hypothetical protein
MFKKIKSAANSDQYKKFKPQLRKEFSYACAYCETREAEKGGMKSFHIDHYKPKKHFPELTNEYNNLIYSCRDCNSYKGSYWPNYIQKILQKIILNPRKDNINEHINKNNHKWTSQSKQGEWNIFRLRLDSPSLILLRKDRSNTESAINKLENILVLFRKGLDSAKNQNEEAKKITELEDGIFQLEAEISTLKRKIAGPSD